MKRNRGSVLIHVIVALVVISGITFALLTRAVSSQDLVIARRAQNEAMLVEDAARSAVRAAVTDAIKSGDFNSIGARVSAVLQVLDRAEWSTVTFNGDLAIPNVLAKSQIPSGGSFGTPFDGSAFIGPRVEHSMEARMSLGTTLNGSNTISRDTTISVTVLEIPSVEFQLIATEAEFVAEAGSTSVAIDGKAFLNGGLKRSLPDGITVTPDGVVFLPVRSADSLTDLNIPAGMIPRASWGLADTNHLAAEPADVPEPSKSAVFAVQNYPTYLASLPSGRSITWSDPAIPPATLPLGVSFQSFNGVMRIVINLSTYVAEDGLNIVCSEATKDIGVVIAGSNSASTAPAMIVTNGRLILYGNNERPVLLASSYSVGHTVVSASFTGAAGEAAADTTWRAYLVLPVENLPISTIENWSGKTYTLFGTLLVKGGTIKGIPSLSIKSDSSLKATMESVSMNADRFTLTFARLSTP